MKKKPQDALITFPGRKDPFLMKATYCDNPGCPCNSVFLFFTEVPGETNPSRGRLSFRIDLDVETWEETEPPDRPEETARLAAEFIGNLSEEMKRRFKAEFEEVKENKRLLKLLDEYTLPREDVEKGLLVSLAGIIAGLEGKTPPGTRPYDFAFSHEGRDYLGADLYCPRPDCKCKEAHLSFAVKENRRGKTTWRECALVAVSLKGKISVRETAGCTRREAEAIAAAWRSSNPHALEKLRSRYREVKKIGKRSLAGRRRPPRGK